MDEGVLPPIRQEEPYRLIYSLSLLSIVYINTLRRPLRQIAHLLKDT